MNIFDNKHHHGKNFDFQLSELRKVTNLKDDEIINFVEANAVSYEELNWFCKKYAKMPDYRDIKIMHELGISGLEFIESQALAADVAAKNMIAFISVSGIHWRDALENLKKSANGCNFKLK